MREVGNPRLGEAKVPSKSDFLKIIYLKVIRTGIEVSLSGAFDQWTLALSRDGLKPKKLSPFEPFLQSF